MPAERRSVSRRGFITSALGLLCAPRARAAAPEVTYPDVVPGHAISFPRDHGSHDAFRTEWWYLTAWLQRNREPLGVQVTFFRHRPDIRSSGPSRFAPRQLLFAHAAIADPRLGRLRHDQRVGRVGFGLAEAGESTTDVHIDDWSLRRDSDGYVAQIAASSFSLDLTFLPTQPPLPQGENGYSRKGPRPLEASYYVSEPQLATRGRVEIGGERFDVQGRAWCDHEWSSRYLAPEATGWDWTGINLDDGSALMAFVIRRRGGGMLWAGGSFRAPDGRVRVLSGGDVAFEPRRTWRSPRTGATYPVAVTVHAGDATYALEPLFDDQELDARPSTGIVYWEGAVRALEANGRERGRGYLELTGYAGEVRL